MMDEYEIAEHCQGCGGGLDEHPSLCLACRYERQFPGRSYERDVDAAQKMGLTMAAYVRRVIGYVQLQRAADRARAALVQRS